MNSRFRKAHSGKTSSTASMLCRCTCQRCASARRILPIYASLCAPIRIRRGWRSRLYRRCPALQRLRLAGQCPGLENLVVGAGAQPFARTRPETLTFSCLKWRNARSSPPEPQNLPALRRNRLPTNRTAPTSAPPPLRLYHRSCARLSAAIELCFNLISGNRQLRYPEATAIRCARKLPSWRSIWMLLLSRNLRQRSRAV